MLRYCFGGLRSSSSISILGFCLWDNSVPSENLCIGGFAASAFFIRIPPFVTLSYVASQLRMKPQMEDRPFQDCWSPAREKKIQLVMKEIQAKRQGFSWQDIDNPFAQTGSRWTRWTQRPGWGEMWFPATCFFKCKLLSGLSRTYDDPSCFFSLRLQRNTTIGREWNNPRAGCFRPSNPKLESPLQHSILFIHLSFRPFAPPQMRPIFWHHPPRTRL